MRKNTRSHKGKSILGFPDSYVVIDIETTGFSPFSCDVIEIGAVKVINNSMTDVFQSLIRCDNRLPRQIVALTGITDAMIAAEGRDADEVMRDLDLFIGDSVLVGHNVSFDLNFLYDYYERYLHKPLVNDHICTMRLAKKVIQGLPSYKLAVLTNAFKLDNKGAHRALNDVYVTNDLYRALRDMLALKGQVGKETSWLTIFN